MTQNEVRPGLAFTFAARFGVLFKDASRADRVALLGKSLEEVFPVRGEEGDYLRSNL